MTLLFAFPEQATLAKFLPLTLGEWEWRHFPDGESYVRVLSEVHQQETVILCSLNQPDTKTLPLIFLARMLKEMDAAKITLISPYLGYMRQDKRFKSGEAITSEIFAELLSPYIDALITVDPHLHRHHRMEEIYDCECKTLSAAPLMAQWMLKHVSKPLVIGPDAESEQWVKLVAQDINAPYVILNKTRHGDRDVEITLPPMTSYADCIPVLVDDIVSTAATMLKAIELLRRQGYKKLICLATHGLFAGDAYDKLRQAGAQVITANTVTHPSNGMDIAPLLTSALAG